MEPLIDNVVRKLHHLPQPKLYEVLNFLEFLTWQEERWNQLDIGESAAEINESVFEDIADQLSEELTKNLVTNVPLLSDCAVSRTGIYEEHP